MPLPADIPARPTVAPADGDAFTLFRRQARALLAAGVPPEEVHGHWQALLDPPAQPELFGSLPEAGCGPDDAGIDEVKPAPPLRVPRRYLELARRVVLHASPMRFTLLYRLLWRMQHEHTLRHDLLDPDWLTLQQMARAVRRDAYKMRAFVRFRPVHEPAPGGGDQNHLMSDGHDNLAHSETPEADSVLHVAWFEPEHDVLSLVAPWFARRFAGMRWAILTPRGCLRWEPQTQQLHRGPAAQREEAPAADAGEALWLTYYRHTFNPARLNLSLMQRHMPGRYWANLPEAAEIRRLGAEAPERLHRMTSAPALKPPESSKKPVKTKNT